MVDLKPIQGFGYRYSISPSGKIYVRAHYETHVNQQTGQQILVHRKGRWYNPQPQKNRKKSSPVIIKLLDNNGKKTPKYLHVLVAEAFLPKPEYYDPNKHHVKHINEDKADNQIENLHWVNIKKDRHVYTGNLTMGMINAIREKYSHEINNNLAPNIKSYCEKYKISQTIFSKIVRNRIWVDENYTPLEDSQRVLKVNLTDAQINEIRRNHKRLAKAKLVKDSKIWLNYNISKSTYYRIIRNETRVTKPKIGYTTNQSIDRSK